jgi:hypothetical protein
MTKTQTRVRQILPLAALASTALLVPRLAAQAQPAPTTPAATTSTTPAAAANTTATGDVVTLSPFEVSASEDRGYRATSTLAGTRIKTDLRDVGSSISVITAEFLKDTGARNAEDLLVYTLGTEVGGLAGNYTGVGNGVSLNETGLLLRPNENNRVRGLGAADNTRDFFLSDIPWDSYNVGRVDLQRGPNAILFGLGKPAGIVNSSLNTAGYKNTATVETRIGSYGSYRGSLDINRVILPDELALRFDAVKDRTKFQQEPAFNDDARIFGALRYDPKFLKRGSAQTSLRVNYEKGDIDANRPRTLPPIDRISRWFDTGTTTVGNRTFNNLNRQTFDTYYFSSYFPNVPNSGATVNSSPNYQPGLSQLYGGSFAFFPEPSSGVQQGPYYVSETGRTTQFGIGPNGAIDQNVGGLPFARMQSVGSESDFARNMGLPFASDYKNKSLTDPSVFDFYERLVDGPNKREVRAFEAFNVVLTQTFLNNRLGLEATFDRQRYQDAQDVIFEGGNVVVTVDVNNQLPDNSPNPNVGRPMIVSRSTYGSNGAQSRRTGKRLTGFGEFRSEDFLQRGRLTQILGRHVFTGVASEDTYDRNEQQWARYAINNGADALLGTGFDPAREIQVVSYLGPDLRGATSARGLNLSNVTGTQVPSATAIRTFDSRWARPTNPTAAGYVDPAAAWVNPFNGLTSTQSENPENYGGWRSVPITVLDSLGDRRLLTRNARKNRNELESQVFVWQGFLFGGNLVPTFGYRQDTAKSYTVTAPNSPNGHVDQNAASFVLPSKPNGEVEGATKSYSLVGHTPRFIRERLPFGLNVSLFWNKSENFEPAAGRVDMLNRQLAAPTGKTKDYGILISALNDRLVLRVNKYESTAQNASYGLSNTWFIGAVETRAWVAAKRFEAGLTGDPRYAGQDFNYGTSVNGVFTQTPAERSLQQQHVAAVLGAFDGSIWEAWKSSPTDNRWQTAAWDPWGNSLGGDAPPGMTATADTLSKGYEIEVNFKPVQNWDIAINAAKTEASRTNIAGNMRQWIEARNAVWNGTAGDIRMWNGTGTDSIKAQWNSTFYNNFALQQLLSGSNVPELRPWRFNLITNYRLIEGRFKGANVGGAYRWEDKVSIGYPSVRANVNGTMLDSYDITRPFWGPKESSTDLWVGYERRIMRDITWRAQLNVRNAFGKNELIPINAQPDGSAAGFRIKEGPTWTLTNSFTF